MLATSVNILKEEIKISIFRTTIDNEGEMQKVTSLLNQVIGENQWNFDFEDIDNILRIHAATHLNGFLTQELRKLGFACEELF